jgi:sigma-B regulation protein RsbU (phosphoserine phosphatase)
MRDAQRETTQLRRILEVTRLMANTVDLDALLNTIVETACTVLDCERATVFLYDPERDELYSRVAKGVTGIRFPADRGIAGAAAMERTVVNVPDAYADCRFNKEVDKKTGFRTRNLLTFPLENLDGHLIGVLQALNRRDRPFGEEEEELAQILSAQCGVAIDRARLLEEYAEKQRMERDLAIARGIQASLFPQTLPQVAGYELAGWNKPADECGGDTYDLFGLPDGRLLIALADATGHGIGPALVIAQFHALVRGMVQVTHNIEDLAAAVNNVLCDQMADERFVTAFVGLLDPQRHVLNYVSAGQGPILFARAADGSIESRGATSVPLAVIPGCTFESATFEFSPGDLLVLLTDGFYEAPNHEGELYGEARVCEYVRRELRAPPLAIISGLHNDVDRFSGNVRQADDLTAVALRRVR